MNRDVVGWIVGIIAFCVIGVPVVLYSEARWSDNMTRARRVHPGWKLGEGKVLSQRQPNFNESPPEVPSLVQFKDYYGRTREVTLNLVDSAVAAHTTEVDVTRDGSIYAPYSYNDNGNADPDQPFKGPQAAASEFWPARGITIGLALDGIISGLLAGIAYAIAGIKPIPSLSGRLGAR